MSLPSRLASLAGWVPVFLVFGQHFAAPAGVEDSSMAPALRGPGGGGEEEHDDGGDDRRRSKAASTSTAPQQDQGEDQKPPSLFSVTLSGGDVVLVDKMAARMQRYRRGDVVVIR